MLYPCGVESTVFSFIILSNSTQEIRILIQSKKQLKRELMHKQTLLKIQKVIYIQIAIKLKLYKFRYEIKLVANLRSIFSEQI